MTKKDFIHRLGEAIWRFALGDQYRAIKDVESWDGSASRWPDTEAYCADCLIDVNAAAGREEKAQSHCALPVREPGDSTDTYVRQAVYAAAGGRGISRLVKPDDVPEEAWMSAVESAANAIIAAYEEMDEVAPDSVFEGAGKEPMRAMDSWELMGRAGELCEERDGRLIDLYHDEDGMYAVMAKDGGLYRLRFDVLGREMVVVSEEGLLPMASEVTIPRSNVTVTRQANGQYRWVAIACTSFLNRSGEIDSSTLFDSFINRFEQGTPVQVDFYHVPGTYLGDVDFVARDGVTLVASGVFRDDAVGKAAAQGIIDNPGYWGTSIAYVAQDIEMARFDEVEIPVYTSGTLRKISILPERDAAALFTRIEPNHRRDETMDLRIKEALGKLFSGDEELVTALEAEVDAVNQRATEPGMVHRDTTEAEPEPERTEVPPDVEATLELRKQVNELNAKVMALAEQLNQAIPAMTERLAILERGEEQRRSAWLQDLPQGRQVMVAPRQRQAEEQPGSTKTLSAAEIAAAEYKKMTGGA